MEKLASVLWKPAGSTDADFASALLDTAPEIAKRGAARLRIDVVDDAVAAGTAVRVGSMDPPKDAVVFYWLDEGDLRGPIEAILAEVASRVALRRAEPAAWRGACLTKREGDGNEC